MLLLRALFTSVALNLQKGQYAVASLLSSGLHAVPMQGCNMYSQPQNLHMIDDALADEDHTKPPALQAGHFIVLLAPFEFSGWSQVLHLSGDPFGCRPSNTKVHDVLP